jgi:ADP-ribosylation factor 1/2
MGGMFSKIW